MASERTEELYRLLLSKGYPKELCAEIAYKNMKCKTASGYLAFYTTSIMTNLQKYVNMAMK